MAAATDLYDALEEFFNVCYAALADSPGGQPDVRPNEGCAYISEGPPAWDCLPTLICHIGGPQVGDTFPLQPALSPLHRVTTNAQVNLVSFVATVLRCQALVDESGIPPSPADHAAIAKQTSGDLWAIWNHLAQAKRDGALFAAREREFEFAPAIPVQMEGGACGYQITIRTELGGYRPAEL